jgi:hypothetical protein
MRPGHAGIQPILDRRTLLTASALGLAGLYRPSPLRADSPPAAAARAKSVILFWLSGGASHIDTWDMKPDAPVEYRGPFKPIAASAPGVRLCEHLPLLDDLHERGLLEQTLVLVSSEMGRTPKVGDPRSGGVRGGQVYGASDRIAAYPADRPVAPEDVARTVYHALGITDKTGIDREGRPFDLLPGGKALTELF